MRMTTKMTTGSPTNEDARPKTGTPDIVGDVKELAGEAAGQAKEIAENQITLRKDKALDTLGNVAQALRETSRTLGSRKEPASDYVLRAADGVDKVAQYLRSRDLGRVVRDVESFARREPAIFLGGAFVAGLIGSRFLKSSGTHPPDANDGARPDRGDRPRAETGPRTATGGAWPRESGSGTRSHRQEATASPFSSGASDARSSVSQGRSNAAVGGSSSFGAIPGGAGASSATPMGSGRPVVHQTDVTSTQPRTPPRTPGYGAPSQGGPSDSGTTQGGSPQGAGHGAPQGKP
jgi:hypothetical protein